MMLDFAIHVENLSKQYQIGAKQARYQTLRGALVDALTNPVRRLAAVARGQASVADTTAFWALNDISFEIKAGETVGVIGRNGAGKSTLLKILSQITEPTNGHALIQGRVGSLLEVGTGFHPELTGRENIYLNGAILGMKRAEIDRKFDEIVAFAEVEKFVDTTVKHYSSGMYLRLAFAVAAHLEPEILLVDEVLAVGDAAFQKKCLAKMAEVGQTGRTVLFVSHNMPAVTRLCERTIWLDGGHVMEDGPSAQIVSRYLTSGLGTRATRTWPNIQQAPGNEVVRLLTVSVQTDDGVLADAIDVRQTVGIELIYEVLQPGHCLSAWFTVLNEDGVFVFSALDDHDPAWRDKPRPVGRYRSMAWIPGNLLTEGLMVVNPALVTVQPKAVHCNVTDAVAFQVVDKLEGDSARGRWTDQMLGVVRPKLTWQTNLDEGV
ncbi:MAG: ABC transporter ATP-binding protein [Chloroflexota bacterium]